LMHWRRWQAKRYARELQKKIDEGIQKIVLSWPAKYDTARAKELGFSEDVGLEQTIVDFIEGEKQKK